MGKSKTYELMLKIGGKADSSLKKACEAADKNLSAIGETAAKVGKITATAVTAAAAATLAAGKAAYNMGAEFDSAYDTIRIGTGATGEALESLKGSMKAVYSAVPAEMADAAQAISDYNTRLGVTGETLETLSKQAIQVSSLLDEDLTAIIENSSQAFQQWNIAEENMAEAMDYVFKVSQSTGVGFSTLMSEMQSYGAQLQACGYEFQDAAALLGQVEKRGYDASTIFTALKTAAKTAADDGFQSINEGIQSYISKIKNAQSETEAYNLAVDVFGSKAASTMIDAIQNGTLSISDFTAELTASTESIATAAADTYDLSEKWQIFKNRINVALEPIATTVFDKVGEAAEKVMPKIEQALPVLQEWLGKLMDKLPEIEAYVTGTIIPKAKTVWGWIQKNKTALIALAKGIGTAVVAFKGISAVASIIKVFQVFGGVGKAVSGVLGGMNLKLLLIVAVIGAVVAAGVWLYQNWDTVKAKAAELGAKIGENWSNIKAWVGNAVSNLVSAFQDNFPLLSAFISGWWESIQNAWVNVQGIFNGIVDFVKNVFSGNWEAAWQNIVDIFGNVFGLIVNLAKAPINGVISAINWVLEKINSISVTIPDWVPGVGGQTLGFNIPTIPALASGGIATAPTLAQIAEGGEPEAVLPLSKLGEMLRNGSLGGGGNLTYAPVYQIQGSASRQDVEQVSRMGFEDFKRWWKQMQNDDRRKRF